MGRCVWSCRARFKIVKINWSPMQTAQRWSTLFCSAASRNRNDSNNNNNKLTAEKIRSRFRPSQFHISRTELYVEKSTHIHQAPPTQTQTHTLTHDKHWFFLIIFVLFPPASQYCHVPFFCCFFLFLSFLLFCFYPSHWLSQSFSHKYKQSCCRCSRCLPLPRPYIHIHNIQICIHCSKTNKMENVHEHHKASAYNNSAAAWTVRHGAIHSSTHIDCVSIYEYS